MKSIKIKVLFIIFSLFILPDFLSPILASEKIKKLPAELRDLQIRDNFIKSSFKEVGTIDTISGKGKLIVVHRADKKAYYASEKNPLYENDALYTLSDCRCRLAFKDQNVVIMAPDTHLDIDEVYASMIKSEKRSLFGMMKGKAIFYALRLFRYKKMKLELKTPAATIGVRGTKFGTEIEMTDNFQSNILNRMVASRNPEIAQVETGKQNIITRVYVFEGEVDVTSLIDGRMQHLRENEILEADKRGLGEVKFDPAKTKSFLEDVTTGMEPAAKSDPQILDKGFNATEMEMLDKTEKIIDIQQKAIEHTIEPMHEPASPGAEGARCE